MIPLGILSQGVVAAGAFDLLETQILTSSASSVTFTGLGSYSDYKHLQIRAVARDTATTSNVWTKINFNGDFGANYVVHGLNGTGSKVESEGYTGFTWAGASQHPGADLTNAWAGQVIDILDFSSSTKNTTLRGLSGWSSATIPRISLRSSAWLNTSSVTSMQITAQTAFATGSRFSIYGLKG